MNLNFCLGRQESLTICRTCEAVDASIPAASPFFAQRMCGSAARLMGRPVTCRVKTRDKDGGDDFAYHDSLRRPDRANGRAAKGTGAIFSRGHPGRRRAGPLWRTTPEPDSAGHAAAPGHAAYRSRGGGAGSGRLPRPALCAASCGRAGRTCGLGSFRPS